MATIIQVNRVNTNRANAASDAVTSTFNMLHGSTALTGGKINPEHLPLGNNFTIENGVIRANPINLTDVHTFDTPQERNDEDGVTWHRGDVAIVAMSGTTGGPQLVTGASTSFNNAPANGIEIFMGYNADGTSRLGDVGDVLGFSNSNGPAPSSTGGDVDNGLGYTIRSIAPDGQTATTAIVVFDSNSGIGVGASVFAAGAEDEGPVESGSWIYTGTDQTVNGVDMPASTLRSDWTLLQTPGSSISTLAEEEFSFGPTTIPSGVTGSEAAGVTVVSATNFGTLTEFPAQFYMYVNGSKISASEITVNDDRTTATFSNAVAFPPAGGVNRDLSFEITYLA